MGSFSQIRINVHDIRVLSCIMFYCFGQFCHYVCVVCDDNGRLKQSILGNEKEKRFWTFFFVSPRIYYMRECVIKKLRSRMMLMNYWCNEWWLFFFFKNTEPKFLHSRRKKCFINKTLLWYIRAETIDRKIKFQFKSEDSQ